MGRSKLPAGLKSSRRGLQKVIPYARQSITQADIDAVVKVLQSDYLTQGPRVEEFEKCLTELCEAKHAVVVNSATSALHLACLALGLKAGQTFWTTPNTFVASANVAIHCGADVDFVDIDPHTYNLCPNRLEEKLKRAESHNKLPQIVMPVHFAGHACDMVSIRALSERYGFKVIEDASHAFGGRYQEQIIGNGKYSDITVFSFHPVKIITTGEGGSALTNDCDLAEKIKQLRSHGVTRNSNLFEGKSPGPWYYEQLSLGFNYRLSEISAALGISQLDRLDKFVSRRTELAQNYQHGLSGLPLWLPTKNDQVESAWHLYVVQVLEKDAGISRNELFTRLRNKNIRVNVHYLPVYNQPYYRKLGFKSGYCPNAESYAARAITLPLYASLTDDQQISVISDVIESLR